MSGSEQAKTLQPGIFAKPGRFGAKSRYWSKIIIKITKHRDGVFF
jgi:hypothetical protein